MEDIKTNAVNDYYDIDIDLCDSCEEAFYLKDLKQRKLFLGSDIEQYEVEEIVKHIMRYNKEDAGIEPENRKPILLYITSNGGDVAAGFELIDIISASKTPIYTINFGYQYSMGFLIGLAGHKRYATPNATILMHDGSAYVGNSSTKLREQVEFYWQLDDHIKSFVLSKSKLTEQEFDEKRRVEWYLFAPEAKEKGFVDYIIGEDCDIDEII